MPMDGVKILVSLVTVSAAYQHTATTEVCGPLKFQETRRNSEKTATGLLQPGE